MAQDPRDGGPGYTFIHGLALAIIDIEEARAAPLSRQDFIALLDTNLEKAMLADTVRGVDYREEVQKIRYSLTQMLLETDIQDALQGV